MIGFFGPFAWAPLLADVGDWSGAVITIVTILIYVVNYLFENSGKGLKKQQEDAERLRRRREVEEAFQRRSAERTESDMDRFLRESRRPERPVEAEIVEAEAVDRGSSLSERSRSFTAHVQKTVDTSDVQSKIDDSIHSRFDHELSSLHQTFDERDSKTKKTVVPQTQVDGLVSLFRDPERFRLALVLGEALGPVDFDKPRN